MVTKILKSLIRMLMRLVTMEDDVFLVILESESGLQEISMVKASSPEEAEYKAKTESVCDYNFTEYKCYVADFRQTKDLTDSLIDEDTVNIRLACRYNDEFGYERDWTPESYDDLAHDTDLQE